MMESITNIYDLYLIILFVLFYNHFWQSFSYMSDDTRALYAFVLGFYAAQYYTGLFKVVILLS